MWEVAFWLVVDDVSERQAERFVAELDGVSLLRLDDHLVEEQWIDRGRLLANKPCQRRALGAMTFACRAQAAEQMHLETGRIRQLAGRQFRAALVKIVRDAHRPDRVRA